MGNSNSTSYRIPDDVLEEIFLLLPVESVLRFRCLSKHWRSILESKEFLERRTSLQKSHLKLLVAHVCYCARPPGLLPESRRLEGEEEMVYLHCNFSRAWMTCNGLVCFLDWDWIHVLNPSTRQLLCFPTGIDKLNFYWSMGFGRDKVTGSYKVVKIGTGKGNEGSVLDVETGEWLKLSPLPCHVFNFRGKSVCVNGSIYWLYLGTERYEYKLLALDLHKQEFHDVSVPATWMITYHTQVANLEDRLVMANTKGVGPELMLEILTMDVEEERWSKTYSISLAHTTNRILNSFTPVALSKQRDLVLYDNYRTLLKANPERDEIRCLSSDTDYIAPYMENLVPLPLKSSQLALNSDRRMFAPKCPFFDPRPRTSKRGFLINTLLAIPICILLLCYCLFLCMKHWLRVTITKRGSA